MKSYGIVILAAGPSLRMGEAKQLLPYEGTSLLQHTIQAALPLSAETIVVLGANAAAVQQQIHAPVQIIYNENWSEGMASSIRVGLSALLQIVPAAEVVILMVCDQPFIATTVLTDLLQTHEKTNKPIVASAYKDTVGTPVFFEKRFFPELLLLQGQEGAKKLIRHYADAVASSPFPMGFVDIDTPLEYENLNNGAFTQPE